MAYDFNVMIWTIADGWFPAIASDMNERGYSIRKRERLPSGKTRWKALHTWTHLLTFTARAEHESAQTLMNDLDDVFEQHRITVAGVVIENGQYVWAASGVMWPDENADSADADSAGAEPCTT